MKKLLSKALLLISCLSVSGAFAANCIALLNYSTVPVKFVTAVDPGYEPIVQPTQNTTLSRDFMQGCSASGCDIFITPTDGTKYTEINSVPKGTQIVYVNSGQYYLDVNANIQCL